MPDRTPHRRRRAHPSAPAASLFALLAALALPAAASDTLFWPAPWTPGQTWQYRTELVETDTNAGQVDEQRITGTSTLRVERDDEGLMQVWTSGASRVEAVRGDRSIADAMAAVVDDLDKIAVELRLDRAGRADGVRNLAQIRPQVRAAMDRMLDITVDAMISAESPDIEQEQRDTVRAMVRPMLAAEMDALIDDTSVHAMLSADLVDFNAFTGTGHRIGLESRAADPLYTPISGQPLAAVRVYSANTDPAQPGRARIAWTTALDTDDTADAALWTLAAEIANEPALKGSTGRPIGLEFVEEGQIEWRPADGAILRMQIERRQRYGRDNQSTSRLVYTLVQSPLVDSARIDGAHVDGQAMPATDVAP